MSFFYSNRFLVAVLVVALGTACYTTPGLLQRVKDEARAPEPEPPPPRRRLQKDSENALKIETLRTLADGYSFELRTSAIKIVASRTVKSQTKDLLLRDLASKDDERRNEAINGMWLLLYHPALTEKNYASVFGSKGIVAAVRALINVMPLHNVQRQSLEGGPGKLPPSPVLPPGRPAQEVSLLILLGHLLAEESGRSRTADYPIKAALKAGLVTEWLAHYPFPCALPENQCFNFKRSDTVRLFDRDRWKMDDQLMASVIYHVIRHPLGRKQLVDAGLDTSRKHRGTADSSFAWNFSQMRRPAWAADAHDDEDTLMFNGRDTAGIVNDDLNVWEEEGTTFLPPGVIARQRSTERSQEEDLLRRRHREAIVVAERGAPLRRENILQRSDSRVLQPMNGVSGVEGALNGLLGLSDEHGERTLDLVEPGRSSRTTASSSGMDQGAEAEASLADGVVTSDELHDSLDEFNNLSEYERQAAPEVLDEIDEMIAAAMSDPDVQEAIQTVSTPAWRARQASGGSSTTVEDDDADGS
ncbi:hypothetical protein EDD37DRAFT_272922 [Exophiala viscosa]|uniref:Uncharacterized protein n=1 Tax=Exophiala viscosa TaxID=2486360 RepID=A0AAN6IKH6_9EURO|nr:hypothetical protein EDD36DRAFT_35485 [Exophiala viscosa]KAI1627697.1 hypothetical protein EDD37DRAFT_272922 [Exophiala viscosa]